MLRPTDRRSEPCNDTPSDSKTETSPTVQCRPWNNPPPLNSINPHIQFTFKEEKDRSLPFLDVLLSHQPDGSILTLVFCKPTHTDKYLHFSSHHPLSHKIAVIKILFTRASSLSSSLVERSTEETHVTQALRMNGYPTCLIQRSVTHLGHRPGLVTTNTTPELPPKSTVTLPYIQGLSESIKRVLEKLDIQVRFRPDQTLRRLLVKPKDSVPPDRVNGVVYRVPCKDCSKAYIGQSGRSLSCCLKEHHCTVLNGDLLASAIAEHAWGESHQVDWEAVEILDVTQIQVHEVHVGIVAYPPGGGTNQQRMWPTTHHLLFSPLLLAFCSITSHHSH